MSERTRNIVRAFNVDHAGNRVGNVIDLLEELMDKAIKEAVAAEREACAELASALDSYWNSVAYERRQAGRDDNYACASAAMATQIAAAIRARKP